MDEESFWDKLARGHIDSSFESEKVILDGGCTLHPLEKLYLGDIEGLKVLHLMCHLGFDTFSLLARQPKEVVGLDISSTAISLCEKLRYKVGAKNISFICADVMAMPKSLDNRFNFIFASYGILTNVKSLELFARNLAAVVESEGRFLLIDGHPLMHIFGEQKGAIKLNHSYFQPTQQAGNGDWENTASVDSKVPWYYWSVESIIEAFLKAGWSLADMKAFPFSSFKVPGYENVLRRAGDGYWHQEGPQKIPMSMLMDWRISKK